MGVGRRREAPFRGLGGVAPKTKFVFEDKLEHYGLKHHGLFDLDLEKIEGIESNRSYSREGIGSMEALGSYIHGLWSHF